ncbi:alkaline phosphatase family protein [Massiliimalia massiliensis]|uniref:alkaline phosphatase family protein n=1 Tax=Massiliimalia massiliensis TaxID=1852384 RepID=UPI0009861AEE|nr:alkaline phosphatase family protein [Massiliimalia massiliensis]
MDQKVVLLLVDGLRPDALTACGNPFIEELTRRCSYTLEAKTVTPSVTLPCHMSLFHSVTPERHGITTNVYTPQVRPITGLADQLALFEKKAAFFYTWEELRDIARPASLNYSLMINHEKEPGTDRKITDAAIPYLITEQPDFLFLYLGETDAFGHDCGWMSEQQLSCVSRAVDCIHDVMDALPAGYQLILTADHGGHDRHHGAGTREDTTTPLFCYGNAFPAGKLLGHPSILDLAPTVAKLCGVPPVRQWDGHSLI